MVTTTTASAPTTPAAPSPLSFFSSISSSSSSSSSPSSPSAATSAASTIYILFRRTSTASAAAAASSSIFCFFFRRTSTAASSTPAALTGSPVSDRHAFWSSCEQKFGPCRINLCAAASTTITSSTHPSTQIDELFSVVNVPTRTRTSDVPAAKAPKTLIDLNRAQNISIILTRIKLPYPAIRDALLSMDEEILTVEHLKALQNCLPTPDEAELVRDYPGDFSQLAAADQFFKQVAGIPRLTQRLNCMLYARKFHVDLAEIKPDLRAMRRAVEELKGSEKFKKILEVVLALGNTLNSSTFRGDARGFQLTDLLKLRDTKPTIISAGTPTLLHYLVRLLNRMDHSLVGFLDECPNVEVAARLSTQSLTASITALMSAHKGLKEELSFLKKFKASPSNDSFLTSMESFYALSSPQIKALGHAQRVIMTDVGDLIAYYGENPTQTKPEEFFAIASNFGQALMRAEVDVLEAEREAEVAAQKKAKAAWLTTGLKDLAPAPEVRGPLMGTAKSAAAASALPNGYSNGAAATTEPEPVKEASPTPQRTPETSRPAEQPPIVDAPQSDPTPPVDETPLAPSSATELNGGDAAVESSEEEAEPLTTEELLEEGIPTLSLEEAGAAMVAAAELPEQSSSSLRTPTASIIRYPGAAVSPSTSDIAEMSFEEAQEPHNRDVSTATLRPSSLPPTDDGLPMSSSGSTASMFRASYGRRRGHVDEGSIRASLGPINSGRKSLKMGSNGRDGNYRPLSRIFLTGDAAGSAIYKAGDSR
ncbi:hypothetical protein OC834_004561 [Tilletia horrida]|nr:hypothetical protein OC834_004561 [Tilletia horrida]